MHLEWLLSPAASFAVVAIGLILCLFLFVSLKSDLRACEARSTKKLDAMETDWNAKMELLTERWEELSRISGLLVPPAPPRSGLNLNKRSQALQMFRRGETPQEISATLSIPRNEVELLVKVHALTIAPSVSAGTVSRRPVPALTLGAINPDVPSGPPFSWPHPTTSPRLLR